MLLYLTKFVFSYPLLKTKVGAEKYAVLSVVGNTLSFDPPSTFSRDEVTEWVKLDFFKL